jgi:sulfite reductase alpha subunit-like flavoprotein
MGREVKEALTQVLVTEGKKTPQEASDFIKRLQSIKRYVAELWEN